jgi:hypothetical protein
MNHSRIVSFLIIYAALSMLSHAFPENESATQDSAKELAERFCRAEFMGVEDIRFDVARYSRKQMLLEKKRDPEFRGMAKFWDNDPLFVVASYRITDVSVKRNHAIATIIYKRLARTEGDGVSKRKLIPDSLEHDIIRLDLIYKESRWWIFDPPIPRISLEAIIRYHKNDLNGLRDDWLQRSDISESQKQSYRKLQENLKILETLR